MYSCTVHDKSNLPVCFSANVRTGIPGILVKHLRSKPQTCIVKVLCPQKHRSQYVLGLSITHTRLNTEVKNLTTRWFAILFCNNWNNLGKVAYELGTNIGLQGLPKLSDPSLQFLEILGFYFCPKVGFHHSPHQLNRAQLCSVVANHYCNYWE